MDVNEVNTYKSFLEKIATIKKCSERDCLIVAFVQYFLKLESALKTLFDKKEHIGMAYIFRGQYEILLQFKFLVEHFDGITWDKTSTQRAECYLGVCLLRKLKYYESKNDTENIKLTKDKLLKYDYIVKEYKDVEKKKPHLKWYYLFNGPDSINGKNGLETHLKLNSNQMYGITSQICHGYRIIDLLGMDDSYAQSPIDISNNFMRTIAGCLTTFSVRYKINSIDIMQALIARTNDETERNSLQNRLEKITKQIENLCDN